MQRTWITLDYTFLLQQCKYRNHMWCNVYIRVNPRIRKQAVHKQWCQISWFGRKCHYLTIKMLYNRCTGIYKFGNNTYPRRIRRRSNLGHIFREKRASYGPGNTVQLKTPQSKQSLLCNHKILYCCLHFRWVFGTVIVSFNENFFLWIIVKCFNHDKYTEFYSVVKHYFFLGKSCIL